MKKKKKGKKEKEKETDGKDKKLNTYHPFQNPSPLVVVSIGAVCWG